MNEVVAIVVPVYNAQNYIADCLNSILAQTYPYFKVYCVDDGSIDNTSLILDDYAKRDDRILVFHTPNAGVAKARNFALSKIGNEDWVSFVDSDDYIGPSMYETIFKAIDKKNVDYVRLFCKRTLERYSSKIIDKKEIKSKIVSCEDYFIFESVGGYISSLFIKKNIIMENHLLFPENMSILEDQVFSIKCATLAKHILILEEPKDYYYYKGNEVSITNTIRDNSVEIIRCINSIYSAFHELGSLNIINKYFYDKFLPLKLEMLYKNRIGFKSKSVPVKLSPEIKIQFWNLSFKIKIYYLIVRLLNLL